MKKSDHLRESGSFEGLIERVKNRKTQLALRLLLGRLEKSGFFSRSLSSEDELFKDILGLVRAISSHTSEAGGTGRPDFEFCEDQGISLLADTKIFEQFTEDLMNKDLKEEVLLPRGEVSMQEEVGVVVASVEGVVSGDPKVDIGKICDKHRALHKYLVNFVRQMEQSPIEKKIADFLQSQDAEGVRLFVVNCAHSFVEKARKETPEDLRSKWDTLEGLYVQYAMKEVVGPMKRSFVRPVEAMEDVLKKMEEEEQRQRSAVEAVFPGESAWGLDLLADVNGECEGDLKRWEVAANLVAMVKQGVAQRFAQGETPPEVASYIQKALSRQTISSTVDQAIRVYFGQLIRLR